MGQTIGLQKKLEREFIAAASLAAIIGLAASPFIFRSSEQQSLPSQAQTSFTRVASATPVNHAYSQEKVIITDPSPMPAWQQERAAATVKRGHAEILVLQAER